MDNLEKYLEEWTLTLGIPKDYNQGPRCPYAKSAKSKIVKCPNYNIFQFWAAVSEECEQFDTTDDITIIASNTIYKVHEIDSVVDAEKIIIQYENIRQLQKDLKNIGSKVLPGDDRSKSLSGVSAMKAMYANYGNFRSKSGDLPATYEVIYGSAWKKMDNIIQYRK